MKDNILFLLSHPKEAIRAWYRQQYVKTEISVAPPGTIIEEFEVAPLREAARQMGLGQNNGGVRAEDWPEPVQKEMRTGKVISPDGRHSEHPNV